jgi:ribosomal protein L24E
MSGVWFFCAAFRFGVPALLCLVATGCGETKSPAEGSAAATKSAQGDRHISDGIDSAAARQPVRREPAFGGSDDRPTTEAKTGSGVSTAPPAPAVVTAKLKPLQVIVGRWNGTPLKPNVRLAMEAPVWRWDYSDPKQPALAFESTESGYLKKGRLTYLPDERQFRLIAELRGGALKTYAGDADAHVRDVPVGDGKTVDRTFSITFTQVDPPPKTREDLYRIAIQQVANNRYLLIVSRKTGARVAEVNRIGNQRAGTSFAAKLDDYGDKTCVISQGLGTMTVTHNGKTFYVCCSGCKKAFEAEPEKWIARFEEWKRKNKK